MKVSDPRWLDQLAGEYVLGTLRGQARRRFERALTDARVSAAVAAWEERLAPLAAGIAPVAPRADTWRAIQRRLGLATPQTGARRRWSLPGLALAAAIGIVAVGVSVQWWRATHGFHAAALVAENDGRPLWQVELSRANDELRVTVVGEVTAPADKDFELWALPEGGAPVSLGLLPTSGRVARSLSGAQRHALAGAQKVAVSIEPRGGSTTGAPTGPVVHVVPIVLAARDEAPRPAPG